MSFLVDTDTCSAYLKGNRAVNNRFLQYTGGLYISTVTLGELYTWGLRANAPPKRLQSLLELLRDVTTLDVTGSVAQKFGEVRAALLDRGLTHLIWTCSSLRRHWSTTLLWPLITHRIL